MDWSDERYVRLYTRDTTTWKLLPWQGKALLPLLLRKVDRAGAADVGEPHAEGIAALCDLPLEVVEPGLAALMRRGVVVANGPLVILPNFLEAQEARASEKARQREHREKLRYQHLHGNCESVTKRDTASQNVTNCHTLSHGVTGGHAESHGVTPSLAVPSLAVPSLAVPDLSPLPPKGEASEVSTEQPLLLTSPPAEQPPLPRPQSKSKRGTSSQVQERAQQVLQALNDARGRVGFKRPLSGVPGNLLEISARLGEGATVEDCLHVIAVCEYECSRPGSEGDRSKQYFDAVTPFRSQNFARKLGRQAEHREQSQRTPEREYPNPTEERRRMDAAARTPEALAARAEFMAKFGKLWKD